MLAPYIYKGEEVQEGTMRRFKIVLYCMVVYLIVTAAVAEYIAQTFDCEKPSKDKGNFCYKYVIKINGILQVFTSLAALVVMLVALWKIFNISKWAKMPLKKGMMILHVGTFTLLNIGRVIDLVLLWNYEIDLVPFGLLMLVFIIMQFILLYVLWNIGASNREDDKPRKIE